jgi:prefoldin beta subunit
MPKEEIPPEAQQLIIQFQSLQQTLQAVMVQKENSNIEKAEVENALDELSKTKDSTEVFKIAGPILIKVSKKDIEKELTEKKETIEVRLKNLENQEAKLTERLRDIQKKLQNMFSSQGASDDESAS